MGIEYYEYHYGGMYNVYMQRRIFFITEFVHMNAGVSSEKENVKESQSRSVTPSLNIHFGCRAGGRHNQGLPHDTMGEGHMT